MKRIRETAAVLLCVALLLALALPACALAQASEGMQIAQAIAQRYPDANVEQIQRWGNTAAAVFAYEGRNILCVLELSGEEWRMTVDNPNALLQQEVLPSLWLDSDNALYWTYDAGSSMFSAFKAADGSWGEVSQILRETQGDRLVEHEIALREGKLVHSIGIYDENENPLEPWRIAAQIPAAFLYDCIALADFDASRFPVYAAEEYEGQWPGRAFIEACAKALLVDHAFVGGALADGRLQLLMDTPQGERVFVGVSDASGPKLVKSAPLPKETIYGVENFTTSLGIGKLCVTLAYDEESGRWGVSSMLADDGGSLCFGRHCIFSTTDRDTMLIGDHPWNDVTKIAWDTLPVSIEAAKAFVDTSRWTKVANPDPADRLHLRRQPDKGSASLGKYYNGTPVKILEMNGDWVSVQVGDTRGYMMKKFLNFSGNAYDDLGAMPQLQAREETLLLYETPDDASPGETIAADYDLRVIGIVSDTFFHVWFPMEGKYGYVRQDALWPGNG